MRATRILCLVAIAGCSTGADEEATAPPEGDARNGGEPVSVTGVELVDSIPWEDELTGGVHHRVVVRLGAEADTLRAIAVGREPVAVGDSAVTGFDLAGGSIVRGFWYDAVRRSVDEVPLPDDFLSFAAHALAPDGRGLAYVGQADDDVRLVATVRSWPSGEKLWTSEPVEGYPSDAKNSSVDWASPDSVEIRIRLDALESGRDLWLRLAGNPSGTMTVDTLDAGPLEDE